jgi:hypothetical protein
MPTFAAALFAGILGITDARDERLNFVGGNKDAAYLQSRADPGERFAFRWRR